jgi:hypothetical protein
MSEPSADRLPSLKRMAVTRAIFRHGNVTLKFLTPSRAPVHSEGEISRSRAPTGGRESTTLSPKFSLRAIIKHV